MHAKNENQVARGEMSIISEPIKRKKHVGAKPVRTKKPPTSDKPTASTLRDKAQQIDLLAILKRRQTLIMGSGLAGLLIGLAYYFLLTPKYESRSELMLLQNDSARLASHAANGSDSISQDLLATHMNLIQSQRIINQALINHSLTGAPSLVEKITDDETMVDYVIDNLYVTRGGKGAARNAHTLKVAFRHTDVEDCTKVVAAIVEEYQAFVSTKFKDINEEAVKLINTARLELDQEIEKISDEYKEFRNSSPLISQDSSNIHEVRYLDISNEMSTLTMKIDETKGRLNLVLEGLKRVDVQTHPLEKLSLIDEGSAERLGIMVTVESGQAQTATFQALQPQRAAGAETEFSKLLELKTRLTNARVVYGPKHPQVQELETQIQEIEGFLSKRKAELNIDDEVHVIRTDDVMNAYVRMLRNDIFVMEQRLTDLNKQQLEAETAAKDLVRFELEDDDLTRRRVRMESLYDSVITRLKEINMRQDTTGIIQEVIEEPTVGERVSPSELIAVIVTVLATMFLAGSSVLVAELMDQRIYSLDELEELYGTSVIGQIINFAQHEPTQTLMKQLQQSNGPVAPALIAFHDAKNPISEVVRTIRTQTLFNLGRKGQILAVTSPLQGDGKSTITANLAVSFASTGKRILLVDCDLRRPTVHTIFGLGNEYGLKDVCTLASSIDDCLQSSAIENLTVLTSGGIPDNPAELLSSERFSNVLLMLRQQFDIIILDCPPVLPVTDPSIIAPLADGLLLVTGMDSESLVKSRECQRVLSRLDCDLVGIVVNRSILHSPGYYKKYQGYYQAKST